jgi:signal transduction histidine kinase
MLAAMHFPPPIRIAAPLLALVFGLAATFLEYRLNLDADLTRHLADLRASADANGRRLVELSERLLASGDRDALQADLEAMKELPLFEIAGVLDENGGVLVDSTGTLRGQLAAATPLAEAAALINAADRPVVRHGNDAEAIFSAHPFRISGKGTGWVLLEYDRTAVIASTQADARTQLWWMASAMALLSFTLWAVLHFGFATRLGRLADSVRAFGEGTGPAPKLPSGGDEVGALSGAFSAMAAKLREREREQVRLEREVLETSEGEQQRIGRDLHDGLGQRLTAASMAANAAVAALQADAPAHAGRVADIGRQLREAIAETRALAHGLAPVDLKGDGLMQALHALAADTAQSTGVRCIFECPVPVEVPETPAAVHLYRIAQEAVNNALKHAAPGEIRIGLERRDGAVLLEVDDDGAGLPETLAAGGGIGLRVMRHRTKLAGGTFEIGSAPAGGTRISCHLKS